jgi:hypothetical protein
MYFIFEMNLFGLSVEVGELRPVIRKTQCKMTISRSTRWPTDFSLKTLLGGSYLSTLSLGGPYQITKFTLTILSPGRGRCPLPYLGRFDRSTHLFPTMSTNHEYDNGRVGIVPESCVCRSDAKWTFQNTFFKCL